MSRVQVLLSTHDGARWLEPLLASVLGQRGVDVGLLVRDDGSRDATPAILRARAADPRVSVVRGGNLGVPWTYFELLERSDAAAALLAFCDQDDVWLPHKLRRAADELGRLDPAIPALYCGRQILTGPALDRLGLSPLPRRGPSFANALVENVATGCTVVLNRAARERIVAAGRPACTVMHDWWAYLVVAALGRVVYDPEPGVLYRQHGGNVVGTQASWRGRWAVRIGRFARRGRVPVLSEQARELDRLHGAALGPEPRRVLDRFLAGRAGFGRALAYATQPDVYRQAAIDDWILRALLVLRRI